MRARTAAITACLTLTALTGCSTGSDPAPAATATVTATKTPKVSAAAARTACVDAWAEAISADPDTDIDQVPGACAGLPGDDELDRYMEGLEQRNKANQDELGKCLADPSCTSFPIP